MLAPVVIAKMAKAIRALLVALLMLLLSAPPTDAGLASGIATYGLCQTGCNTALVACYATAGFVLGTVTYGASVPPALAACSTAQGVCMASCAAMAGLVGFTPTP